MSFEKWKGAVLEEAHCKCAAHYFCPTVYGRMGANCRMRKNTPARVDVINIKDFLALLDVST